MPCGYMGPLRLRWRSGLYCALKSMNGTCVSPEAETYYLLLGLRFRV